MPFIGLESRTRVRGIPNLCQHSFAEAIDELEQLGVINAVAATELRTYERLPGLIFRFHLVRKRNAPTLHREIGGDIPWLRFGNIFLFAHTMPGASCIHWCLAV